MIKLIAFIISKLYENLCLGCNSISMKPTLKFHIPILDILKIINIENDSQNNIL